MDKKDEVNEEVHYSDVKKFQHDYSGKNSQADSENEDNVLRKITQTDIENLTNKDNNNYMGKISQANAVDKDNDNGCLRKNLQAGSIHDAQDLRKKSQLTSVGDNDALRNDSHVALVDNNDNLRKSLHASPASIDKNNEENNNETLRKDSQARLININKDSAARKIDLDNIVRTLPQTNVANKDVYIRKTETNSTVSKSNVKPFYKKQETKNPALKPQIKAVNKKQEFKKPDYWGHRERLRKRFITCGIKGLQDNEVLEMILFYTIKYIDTKPIAYNLLNEFGSLEKVFSESYERLLSIIEQDNRPSRQECEKTAIFLKFIRSVALLLWQRSSMNKYNKKEIPVINNGAKLLEYLKGYINNLETNMRDLNEENFRIIFLNANNRIIKDEVMFEGTINQTGVYPRQILKRALEVNATAIIAVHNHPAGTLKPSNADISVTRSLQQACETLGISLLDHLIIGDKFYGEDQQKSFYSFAENGLL